jgi:hypothetical protein
MSNASFEAPKIGDGEQIGDGNVDERLNVGRSGQPVLVQGSTSGNLGFYGTAPVARRAAAAQATSLVGTASSTAVDTNMKAALIEVMNTLSGLGLWKGAA